MISEKSHETRIVVNDALRKLSDDIKSTLKKPEEHGASVRLAFFLGAGTSVQSGVPSTKDMIRHFKRKILEYAGKKVESEEKIDEWIASRDWYDKNEGEYSQLFEKCYESSTKRRSYIESIVEKTQPSVGYIVLANLIKYGYVKTIITTNFDSLLSVACSNYTDVLPVVYSLGHFASEMVVSSERPKILKMHGDFLFSNLQNTSSDLKKPDSNMRRQVSQLLGDYDGIVIIGYAGNDESVMSIFEKVETGKTIYWCDLSDSCLSERARKFLEKKGGVFVPIEGFDELMQVVRILIGMTDYKIIEPFQLRYIEINRKLREFEDIVLVDDATGEIERSVDFGSILNREREFSRFIIGANEALLDRNFDLIVDYFEKSVVYNPDQSIYNRFGLLLEQNEEYWENAEGVYRMAMDKFPNNEHAYYNLANLLSKNRRRWVEAEKLYHDALKRNSSSAIATNCLGLLFYKQKKYPNSAETFKKAIEFDSKLSFPYVNLASLYKTIGDEENFMINSEKAQEFLKPIDFYLWSCLHSAARNKRKTFSYLIKAISIEPGKRLSAKYSPNFVWLGTDKRFKEIVNDR